MSLLARIIARATADAQDEPLLEPKDAGVARQASVARETTPPLLDQSHDDENASAMRSTAVETSDIDDEAPVEDKAQALRRTPDADEAPGLDEDRAHRAVAILPPAEDDEAAPAIAPMRRSATPEIESDETPKHEDGDAIALLRRNAIAPPADEDTATPPEFAGIPETKARRNIARSIASTVAALAPLSSAQTNGSTLEPSENQQVHSHVPSDGNPLPGASAFETTTQRPQEVPLASYEASTTFAPIRDQQRPKVNIGQIDVIIQEPQATPPVAGFFERHAKRQSDARYLRRL